MSQSDDLEYLLIFQTFFKTADGVTRGSYSYVDANGLVQTVNYISDALGFKESCQLKKYRRIIPKNIISIFFL